MVYTKIRPAALATLGLSREGKADSAMPANRCEVYAVAMSY